MSQENIYSQPSNSQNETGQQTLEEIKNRSETIIKQKCRDDFKLNNLQKDHQDFQKMIEEKAQQIANAEKDHYYLMNALEQLEITRGSVKTDVDMIVKAFAEYLEVLNGIKTSVQTTQSEFNQNEEFIENVSEKIQQSSDSNSYEEKLQKFNYTSKLLKDLIESSAKLRNEKYKSTEKSGMKILSLDKDEQDFIMELKVLQRKGNELSETFDLKNKIKDDLQNNFEIKEEKINVDLEEFEKDEFNFDKQFEEMESTYSSETKTIIDIEKGLEELSDERKRQISLIEESENELDSLEKSLSELENMLGKEEAEKFNCTKLIEDLRSESSKGIDEDEKLLESLQEELCNINITNDQVQYNIANDQKILDDLNHEGDLKKDEIISLQNNVEDQTKTIQETEIKYTEMINGYNTEISEIKTEKQNILERKEKFIMEIDNISKMISELQMKNIHRISEDTQIEKKQNNFLNQITEEIANLRNTLVIIKDDFAIIENNYNIQYEEISLKFKERKNEILKKTNQYKEQTEIIEQKEEETFKIMKQKYLDDQTKMELQISEYNAAVDNLQGEFKRIVTQINLDNISKAENVPNKVQNNLNGPTKAKTPEIIKNKKDEAAKVFEWTTDEEEYKNKTQKLKMTRSQVSKTEKFAPKGQNFKKKETSKPNAKKGIITKISSTDSELEWIQPSSKAFKKN